MPAAVIAALAPPVNPAAGPAAPPANGEPGDFARQLERASQDRGERNADDDAAPQKAGARPERAADDAKGRSRVAATDKPGHERKAAEAAEGETPAANDLEDEKTGAASDAGAALPPGALAAMPVAPAPVQEAGSARAGADALRAAAARAQTAQPDGAAGAGDEKAPALRAAADAEATTPAFVLPQPSAPAATPAAANPPAAAAAALPAREAQIAAPLASPAFAPALGAQVSLFVREGIGEARLQLNPAEMGPITVQIRIDGSNAHVNMAAEQAPTRQALEQALPALAGALRESGLTLTGGGVFEQPRQPQDPGAPARPGSRRGGDDDAELETLAPPRGAVARGVVDLYA